MWQKLCENVGLHTINFGNLLYYSDHELKSGTQNEITKGPTTGNEFYLSTFLWYRGVGRGGGGVRGSQNKRPNKNYTTNTSDVH